MAPCSLKRHLLSWEPGLEAHGRRTDLHLIALELCPLPLPRLGLLSQFSGLAYHLECVSGRPGLAFFDRVPRDRLLSADTDNLITSIFSLFCFYFGLSLTIF